MAETHEGAESNAFFSVYFRVAHQPILSRTRGSCFIVPCLMGTCGTYNSCFRTLSFLFSISWTSDACKVEEMCETVEGGLSKHEQNQAEPGTLKPLSVFTLQVREMLNWCFLLLITTHQGQHCAICRLYIFRENRALTVSGGWLQFSLKCPSKYLTGNKALWVRTTLCWLFSLCQVFARKYVF